MNNAYRLNAGFAVSKAKSAVEGWEAAVKNAEAAHDADGIAFCQRSLEASRANLETIRRDVRDNWTAYL